MMKKIFVISLIICCFLANNSTHAQFHVRINISTQPIWGPVGYNYAEYYYLPDVDAFFSIPRREYIYMQGDRWIFSPYLPDHYRNYDLYRGYKIVINEPSPWLRHNFYYERYAPFRGWHGRQATIRDSRDPRYFVIPDHPNYGRKYNNNNNGYNKFDNRKDRYKKERHRRNKRD